LNEVGSALLVGALGVHASTLLVAGGLLHRLAVLVDGERRVGVREPVVDTCVGGDAFDGAVLQI
jgi:hypothetical protein